MADDDAPDADPDTLRTPIVAVLGHVDHGKTSLLDRIRGSHVIEGEAGAITQHIGATAVPLDVVSTVAGSLVDPDDFDLPGLLFIDTPGHHSFTTLRSRGGALADIAILVVDIMDGVQPQTEEAIDILQETATPFVVAANKVDTIPGWHPQGEVPISTSMEAQSERARDDLNQRLYELIGELSDAGFSADVYWQVSNFQRNIGVVPVSAETGEGIADLLTVLMGLSQRYLRDDMAVDVSGAGAGTVLEVTEEKGFGTTLDVILYDGHIEEGDEIVVGGLQGPIVTEVRALLKPRELQEIRTERSFEQVEAATAAAGIKVVAPDLDAALAGAPLHVVGDRSRAEVAETVTAELAELAVDLDDDGLVIKADTLGSLEALASALEEAEIPIVRAEVGDVAPRDVTVAGTADDPLHRGILAFSVDVLPAAKTAAEQSDVEIFDHDVIYRLVEAYEEYVEAIESDQQQTILENITRPCRFQLLPDHTFRQNDPAVVGVEILAGTLKRNVPVVDFSGSEPDRKGMVQGIQSEGEDVESAQRGERVSVAIDGPTVGRQIEEGQTLWVELPEKHAKILEQELKEDLTGDEREALSQYLEKQRRRDPFWGK